VATIRHPLADPPPVRNPLDPNLTVVQPAAARAPHVRDASTTQHDFFFYHDVPCAIGNPEAIKHHRCYLFSEFLYCNQKGGMLAEKRSGAVRSTLQKKATGMVVNERKFRLMVDKKI
jgi:hypothetical protein